MSHRIPLLAATVVVCLVVSSAARRTDSQHPDFIMVLDGSPVHDVGELRLHMSNWGMFGSWPGSSLPFSSAPSGEWPAGSGIEHVFTGGLWVGALKDGVPAVSTAAYRWELRPTASPIDVLYRSAHGAPGGNRFPWPNADDDNDGAIDEDYQNGTDDDADGKIDEDFAAISDQMFSRWYTDFEPDAVQEYPQHNPLHIVVRETSYQWERNDYDDFVGIDYEITNTGNTLLENVHVGVFLDSDVGDRDTPNYWENDVAAFRSSTACTQYGGVQLNYGYIADELIGSGFAVLLLDHPTEPLYGEVAPKTVRWRTFAVFNGAQSYEDGGDPTNDFERYELMSSETIERDSVIPRDHRILLSVGPFEELAPGATLKFSVALVGFLLGDETNLTNAAIAYRGRWFDADGNPSTGVEGRETPVEGPALVALDRCRPPYDQPIDVPRGVTVWINHDCEMENYFRDACGYTDPELYSTGVNGKEHQVHWLLPDENPTPVAIQRFEADPAGSVVNLSWEIWADEDVAGYDLLRSRQSGPLVPLASAIAAATHTYRDANVEPGTRYEYQLVARGTSGWTAMSQRVGVTMPSASLALDTAPNPFGVSTAIRFTIPQRSAVSMKVFDAAGRLVATLLSSEQPAGAHELTWDGRGVNGDRLSAGVYFCRLEAGKETVTRKLLLLH